RSGEGDLASSMIEDPGGLGTDESRTVDQHPRRRCLLDDSAYAQCVIQGVQMGQQAALQGPRAGAASGERARWAAGRAAGGVVVELRSRTQFDVLMLWEADLGAVPDRGRGQQRQVCRLCVDQAGSDSLVAQGAVVGSRIRGGDGGGGDVL